MALVLNLPEKGIVTLDVQAESEIRLGFDLELEQITVSGKSLIITVDGRQIILNNFFGEDGTPNVENFVTGSEDVVDVNDLLALMSTGHDEGDDGGDGDDGRGMETAGDNEVPGSGTGEYEDGSGRGVGDGLEGLGTGEGGTPDAPPTDGDGPDSPPTDPADPDPAFAPPEEPVPGQSFEYSVDGTWGFRGAINRGSAGEDASGDRVSLWRSNETHEIYVGGEGEDTLVMTGDDDVLMLHDAVHYPDGQPSVTDIEVIEAGGGDDLIDLTSPDMLYGDVSVYGEDGHDVIWTNAGNDVLDGGAGHDALVGGLGNDSLYGGDGGDTLKGGQGDDFLSGGEGDDDLYGGDGADLLVGGGGSDLIFLGGGNDQVNAGTGYHDQVTLGDGSDTVVIDSSSLTDGMNESLVSIIDFNPGEDELDLSGLTVLKTVVEDDYTALFVADDADATHSTWVMLSGVDNSALSGAIENANFAPDNVDLPDASEYLHQHYQETNSF